MLPYPYRLGVHRVTFLDTESEGKMRTFLFVFMCMWGVFSLLDWGFYLFSLSGPPVERMLAHHTASISTLWFLLFATWHTLTKPSKE